MRLNTNIAFLILAIAWVSHSLGDSPRHSSNSYWSHPVWSEKSLGSITSNPGLQSLHRDVALLCETGLPAGDALLAQPKCRAVLVGPEGELSTVKENLVAAQRLPGKRFLFLNPDLSLTIQDSMGIETAVAFSVYDPRVSEDGATVLFTQYPPDTYHFQPGLQGRLMIQNLYNGEQRVVTDDPAGSSPFAVPNSEEIIFLSYRTGLASIWSAVPGEPDRQITNIGKSKVDAEFVPVYGRELLWIPGTRKAVYTAHYGTNTLWLLNLDTKKAFRIGPGRMPALQLDGSILAIDDSQNPVYYSADKFYDE